MDASDVVLGRREAGVAIAVLAVVFVLIGVDVTVDYRSGTPWSHLLVELFLMLGAVVGIVALWRRFAEARSEAAGLARDLDRAREEAARWRSEASTFLEGLGQAIDRQFERWSLTEAEREVALLLLKGLSHHAVARVRRTSERTVRQQARSVYAKAGLGGRSELSAFFLEDLLLPYEQRE